MGAFQISLERLNPDVRDAYGRLLPEQNQFGPSFLDWKFDWTAPERGVFSVARDETGTIVGLSAYIAARFMLGQGTAGVALQAIDSVVAEHARGQGLFSKLARTISDANIQKHDLIWGFPNANAAGAWFGKLGWTRHGFVPFLVKPLRAGYLLRKLKLPFDFRLSLLANSLYKEQNDEITDKATDQWRQFVSQGIKCGVDRNLAYLSWRLSKAPHQNYSIAFDPDQGGGIVATTIAQKHGGSIAYVMEAFGGGRLRDLLAAQLGGLTGRGAEVALAWCFPWSPNYRVYRSLGFIPLPERLRPVEIHFGSRSYSPIACVADNPKNWYLSYLDADTI